MIFSSQQIDEVLEIIEFQHLIFTINSVGEDILREEDYSTLSKYGITKNTIDKVKADKFSSVDKSFLFGRLSASLKDQTNKIDYNDFLQYLRRGQFVELNTVEKNVLSLLKKRTDSVIRDQSSRIQRDVRVLLEDRNSRWEIDSDFRELLNSQLEKKVVENRSKSEVILEIGQKTESWEKDLGRIVETELQNIFQYGRVLQYLEQHGDNILLWKEVFPGACKHCIKAYLTNGIGSEPVLFTPQELLSNGTNIGRRPENWRPVLGTMHPFCRCEIHLKEKGDVWDSKKKLFVLPNRVDESRKTKGQIVITVGDKKIVV